jgi:DHA1 family inner membrane transport protein
MPLRALDRSLRHVFAALLLWGVGFGLYNYLWPNYAAGLGANGVELGLLFALQTLVNTAVALPGGWLADRFDRRRVILLGWWIAVPSAVVWALAGGWQALIPGILLYNGSNVLVPSLQAYVAGRAPADRVASTFTLVFAASSLGPVLSPAIGGYLAARLGIRSVFWFAFALFAASAVVLHGIGSVAPRAPAARRARGAGDLLAAGRQVWMLSVLAGVVIGIDTLAWPFFPALLKQAGGAGDVAIGWYGALVSLSAAVGVALSGRLGERLGPSRTLSWAQGILAGATALIAGAPGQPAAVTASLALRGTMDGSRTLMTAQVGASVPPERIGRAFGVYNLVIGVAGAVTPYVGGWLYQVAPSWPFWASVPLMAAVAALVPRALGRRRAPGVAV